MPWATVFLPSHMRQLMNLETSLLLKRASGFNIFSLAVNFLNAIAVNLSFGEGLFGALVFSQSNVDRYSELVWCGPGHGLVVRATTELLRALGAVLRAAALAAVDAEAVEGAADDVVADA